MPTVPLELHPAAIEEAAAARRWSLERSQQAADAFVAEIDRRRVLKEFPKPGHRVGEAQRWRSNL